MPEGWTRFAECLPLCNATILVRQNGAYMVGRAGFFEVEWLDTVGGSLSYALLNEDGAEWVYVVL